MFEDALEERLRAIPYVAASVGQAVSWGRRLPNLPSIAMQVVADPRPEHFKGAQSLRPTLVQVDVLAKTAEQARLLREAVISGLVPPDDTGAVRFRRAQVAGVRTASADQQAADKRIRPEIHHHSIDIRFWHNG